MVNAELFLLRKSILYVEVSVRASGGFHCISWYSLSRCHGLGWEIVDHCRVKASSKDLLVLTTLLNPMECWEPTKCAYSLYTATYERRPTILPGDHSLEVLHLFYEFQDDEIMKSAAAMEC